MATFGLDSGDNTYNLGENALQGVRFQNDAATGTLTKLEILFDDATPNDNVRLGVYADDAGSPAALLLDAGTVAVADGWVEISGLSLGVTLNAYYWLAFVLQSANGVRYQSGQAAGSHAWVTHTYNGLPNPFGTPDGTNNNQYVMRATVGVAAGWTGKISGVTNPAKIMGVAVANISKVKGVS